MRLENQRMKDFLLSHGIEAMPKYISEGSIKGSWRLYNHSMKWTPELQKKLTDLGFTGLHGPLTAFSGNGGIFSVFVIGHNELLNH